MTWFTAKRTALFWPTKAFDPPTPSGRPGRGRCQVSFTYHQIAGTAATTRHDFDLVPKDRAQSVELFGAQVRFLGWRSTCSPRIYRGRIEIVVASRSER